jgi:hypothetical protein
MDDFPGIEKQQSVASQVRTVLTWSRPLSGFTMCHADGASGMTRSGDRDYDTMVRALDDARRSGRWGGLADGVIDLVPFRKSRPGWAGPEPAQPG